jgi:Xaa-Pro aminopeptidase
MPDYLAKRLSNVRAAMRHKKIPALLVTNFADVSWLTGFEGHDSYVIVTADRFLLLSDFRYQEQAAKECPWVELLLREGAMVELLSKTIRKENIKSLGVQAESMTIAQRDALQEKFTGKTRLKILPVAQIIVELRHIKDAHEISILQSAIRIAEDAFKAMRQQLTLGMTENDIAGLLVYEMRKRGALNSSFDTIIAVGANGSLPHYRPRDAKLTHNTSLLVDWGALAHGYCSDLTRVLFFGPPSQKMREIYQVTLDAQLAAIAAIAPGKKAVDIDKIARDIIAKAGYGDHFGHGLGHGIGRDIHEAIAFNKISKVVLKPGMVLTVEPGIYLPGVGGVRIEDDILVTETGCKVLTKLEKSLDWAKS